MSVGMRATVIQGRFMVGGPRLLVRGATAAAQPKSSGHAQALPPGLVHMGSNGRLLPDGVRQKMETFFKADFSDVRVHVGTEAPAIGALAFTLGSNLYFAPGQYNPETSLGQQLLGHELAHVLQQRAGRVRNPFGSGIAVVQDPALEAEADRMGMRAAQFQMAPAAISPVLQRQAAAPAAISSPVPGHPHPVHPRRPMAQTAPRPPIHGNGLAAGAVQPYIVMGRNAYSDYKDLRSLDPKFFLVIKGNPVKWQILKTMLRSTEKYTFSNLDSLKETLRNGVLPEPATIGSDKRKRNIVKYTESCGKGSYKIRKDKNHFYFKGALEVVSVGKSGREFLENRNRHDMSDRTTDMLIDNGVSAITPAHQEMVTDRQQPKNQQSGMRLLGIARCHKLSDSAIFSIIFQMAQRLLAGAWKEGVDVNNNTLFNLLKTNQIDAMRNFATALGSGGNWLADAVIGIALHLHASDQRAAGNAVQQATNQLSFNAPNLRFGYQLENEAIGAAFDANYANGAMTPLSASIRTAVFNLFLAGLIDFELCAATTTSPIHMTSATEFTSSFKFLDRPK